MEKSSFETLSLFFFTKKVVVLQSEMNDSVMEATSKQAY